MQTAMISMFRPLRAPLAGAAMLAAAATGAPAADLPTAVQALVPAAKAEGELFVYGRTLPPPAVKAYSKRLNAFYGFPIDLKMAGGLHTAKAAEITLAVKNGAPTGIDVFWTSYATSVRLEENGVFEKIDWTKLGIQQDMIASAYGVKSHDVSLCFVTYNTNQVKSTEAPKHWKDLLDPKWKGRIALPRSPSPFVYLAAALGEDETKGFLSDLLTKNDAKIVGRFPDVRARVLSGEFALSIGTDAFAQIKKGAPVAMAKMDPMPLSNWSSYILVDSKHPALAKLWAYWLTTADGQKALAEVNGMGFASETDNPLHDVVDGVKVVWFTRVFTKQNHNRLTKEFAEVMGIRR